MIVVGLILLVLALTSIVMGFALRAKDLDEARVQAETDGAAAWFEAARLTQNVEDLLVPLTWAWDLGPRPGTDGVDRLRAYLTAAYTEAQKALLKDDVEMTDAIEAARLHAPPRRLPKYPQVPPYLATPEDAAGFAFGVGLAAREEFERNQILGTMPRHDFDVVTTPPVVPMGPKRYFVKPVGGEWEEAAEDRVIGSGEETWEVTPYNAPETLPPGIRAIVFPDALRGDEEGWGGTA